MKNFRANQENTKNKKNTWVWDVYSPGTHILLEHPEENGTGLVIKKKGNEISVLGVLLETMAYSVKKYEELVKNGNWVVGERDVMYKHNRLPEKEGNRLATLIVRKQYEQAVAKKLAAAKNQKGRKK